MNTKTPQQARQWFITHGISISAWCREHGLSRHTVNDLLRGKQQGRYGQAHRAAVALGLKAAPEAPTNYRKGKAA
jgi:gp16 family phage-associated protein